MASCGNSPCCSLAVQPEFTDPPSAATTQLIYAQILVFQHNIVRTIQGKPIDSLADSTEKALLVQIHT